MKKLVFWVLNFLSWSIFSQNLEGKWLVIRDNQTFNVYWEPNIELLEFKKGKLSVWSYDSVKPILKDKPRVYYVTKDSVKIKVKEGFEGFPITYLKENIIQIDYFSKEENTNYKIAPVTYVKLCKSQEGYVEKNKSFIFKSEYKDIVVETDLEEYLQKEKMDTLNYVEHYFFEKMDDSLILSVFQGGKREKAYLVDKLDCNQVAFYGISESPFLVKLARSN